MDERRARRKRFVVKAEGSDSAETQRHMVSMPTRLSGLLAYYAQTRGLTESMVVCQALTALFRGIRISDGAADAGEDEAAA
jgi:hypothetical protein